MGRFFQMEMLDGVMVLRSRFSNIVEDVNIQAMGQELFEFAEGTACGVKVLLDWSSIEFMSYPFFYKLIAFDNKLKRRWGRLVFCNIRREIYEVLKITKLRRLFDIRDTREQALAVLAS